MATDQTALDLDLVRARLDDAGAAVSQGSGATWKLAANRDIAITQARRLLAEVERLHQEVRDLRGVNVLIGQKSNGLQDTVDALTAERDAARSVLATAREDPDWDPGAMVQLYDQAVDRADQAEAERDEARERASWLTAEVANARIEHRAERDALAAQLERAERVVEAAVALVGDWKAQRSTHGGGLRAAVDAYQAAESSPLAMPGCTCPWNNGYRPTVLGHHVSCPVLGPGHHPGDGCEHRLPHDMGHTNPAPSTSDVEGGGV